MFAKVMFSHVLSVHGGYVSQHALGSGVCNPACTRQGASAKGKGCLPGGVWQTPPTPADTMAYGQQAGGMHQLECILVELLYLI